MFSDHFLVPLREPGVGGRILIGADVGGSGLDLPSDGVRVDVSIVLFGDAGDVAVGAVAFGHGPAYGDEVRGGELADAYARCGHRGLQCFTWCSSPAWERLGSVVGHVKNRRPIWSAVNARLGFLASRKVPGAVARLPAVAFCSSVLSVGFSPLVALSALERRVMFTRFPIAF